MKYVSAVGLFRENGLFACRIYRARLKRKIDVTRLKDRVA